MIIKKTLCLFICFISVITIHGQNNDFQHKKDSLLKVIASTKGEEKLEAYTAFSHLQFPNEELDLRLQHINDFIQEARKQQNKKYECIAYYNELVCYWNHLKFEEFEQKANKYLPVFKKYGDFSSYYLIYRCQIMRLFSTNQSNKRAIEEIKQMYAETKQDNNLYGIVQAADLMGKMYLNEKRYEEAEKYFQEIIKNALQLFKEEPYKRNYYFIVNGYWGLAETLLSQEKTDELLPLMPVWKKHSIDFEKTFGCTDQFLGKYYTCYVQIYVKKEQYDKAKLYCDSIEQINLSPTFSYIVYELKISICEGNNEYNHAIDWIDKCINMNIDYGELNEVVNLLKSKARILSKMGREKESYPILERAFQLNDSLRLKENNAQLDEIRTQYEVDKHIAEKKLEHSYFLWAFSGFILSTIALGIWIYYSRKVTKKNRILSQQISDWATQQEESIKEMLIKTSFSPYSSNEKTSVDHIDLPEKRKDQLCIAIRNMILRDRAYLNPNISRDFVVEQLGTNKDLFIEAFQHCFDTSFTEYINRLRLKDAVILLEQSDLSIEEISEKTGFGTVRTFRRQFGAKYDMTPKDYRNSIIATSPLSTTG